MDVYKFIPGKEFENKIDKNSIMILGEFEFFHKGHNSLLEKAKEAKNENDQIGIFIIEKNKNPILTLDNKLQTLAQIGFDFAIVAEFTTDFMNMSGHDFLQQLERNINISRYIFGSDFAFGKNRQINKENFKDVTDKNFTVVELLKIKNKKISSSDIKEMFLFGEINLINTILVHPLIFDVEFVDQKLKWINKNNLHPGIYYVDILIDEYWYSGIIHISMENNVDFHLINYEFENNVVINQKTKLVLLDIKRVIINQRYDKIERDKLESVINFFEGKNTSSKNKGECMKKIAVVVSSYCGLSKEFVESNDLFYLPLQLIVDDKQWLEGCYNQDEEDKIIKLLNDAEQYQTSLPPLAMITEQMEKLSQEYENVLYITISSHLSSTHDALANEAKKYKNVHIFNNHLSGSALFNVAKKAKEMIEQENKSIEQVLAFLKDFNDKTIGFIVPNGLKEFIKSGRLKGIKKMLMTSINLTLMIEVGPELKTAGVARTKKSAVNKVIEKIWEFAQENKINLKESMISIIWAYEPTIKEIMVQQIQDQKTKLEFVIEKASVVTRMHTGLGAAYIGINPKIK